MDIQAIHEAFLKCGGRLTTDSRKIEPGQMFWALKGENFDGNAFALKALEDGAAFCVVDEASQGAKDVASACPEAAEVMFAVPDTLSALWELAAYHREHTLHEGKRIPVLALTGTNGKTTTKELIRAVLATKYTLTATEGNLNNNIGVPLTVLRMTPDTEMAIVEMGASHPGDINELVAVAHPDFGLITNVGRAHLLGFGSFEGVKRTKGELYDYVTAHGGECFVNTGAADLSDMAISRLGLRAIPYGRDVQQARVLPASPEEPFLSVEFMPGIVAGLSDSGRKDLCTVRTQLVGAYNADNVLAAIAVGERFGVQTDKAVAAIEAYTPSNSRSQMVRSSRNTLIVDAYNANPSSMAAALDNFDAMQVGTSAGASQTSGKAVFLGDMLELGEESAAEHVKVVRRVLQLKPALAVFVGGEFAKALAGIPELAAVEGDYASGPTVVKCFQTSSQAAEWLSANPIEGCVALVKGSRGTRMENVLPAL